MCKHFFTSSLKMREDGSLNTLWTVYGIETTLIINPINKAKV